MDPMISRVTSLMVRQAELLECYAELMEEMAHVIEEEFDNGPDAG